MRSIRRMKEGMTMTNKESVRCNGIIYAAGLTEAIGWKIANDFDDER